ncbi:MAG: hypothetical protein ACRDNF_07395, partial [Streptosporangiaceae bacterium]
MARKAGATVLNASSRTPRREKVADRAKGLPNRNQVVMPQSPQVCGVVQADPVHARFPLLEPEP